MQRLALLICFLFAVSCGGGSDGSAGPGLDAFAPDWNFPKPDSSGDQGPDQDLKPGPDGAVDQDFQQTQDGICTPSCGLHECGNDGCGGSCGTCPTALPNCVAGYCQLDCNSDCFGKQCGDDGCGGLCGTCPPALPNCVSGTCLADCTSNCQGKSCGDDGCGGLCGTCPPAMPNCVAGVCKGNCTANCQGKECGDDGCGGLCGNCPPLQPDCQAGVCISDCVKNCNGKQCGDDGCGGSCGNCGNGSYCDSGSCVGGQGSIVITEIMADPAKVLDASGEWFELHNTGQVAINIGGWAIVDSGSDAHLISAGNLTIPGGGYMVLARKGSGNGGISGIGYVYADFLLANESDEIYLLDSNYNIVDGVEYGPGFPMKAGRAMSLDPGAFNDNNNPYSWCYAYTTYGSGDFGTPGKANPSCY